MRSKLLRGGWLLAILAGSAACTAARIVGKTTLVDKKGAPMPATAGVTVNFINLGATIEESLPAVQTDAKGDYSSPVLPPGKYSVEAMYPGFVIERTTVVLKKHGKKKAQFILKQIRETAGKSVRESQ